MLVHCPQFISDFYYDQILSGSDALTAFNIVQLSLILYHLLTYSVITLVYSALQTEKQLFLTASWANNRPRKMSPNNSKISQTKFFKSKKITSQYIIL